MAPKKQRSSSDSSSEDTVNDTVVSLPKPKRSYECSFCKRGFTNAQALGGHMNIHRRDRKKSTASAAAANVRQPVGPFAVWDAQYRHLYFDHHQTNGTSTNNGYYNNMAAVPPSSVSNHQRRLDRPVSNVEEVVWGTNLSLRVGEAGSGLDDEEEDVMDLELRLGPYPQ